MKDIKLNNLDANQRRLLQIGVILILVLFLGLFYLFSRKSTPVVESNGVYLEDSKLQVFNDTYEFTGYPDKILFHYPYFILVQGNKPLTTIYNLETREKVKEIQDVILDYYDENVVYNRKETFYNDKSLGEFCDSAFIKSTSEILCITKQSQNYADNRLISINPETPNLWKRLYQSDNILTTIAVINDDLYIGEINFESKQNYLTVNENTITVDTPVNMIYEMGGKPYFGSFRSELNNNTVSSYLIESNHIKKQAVNKIYISK
ncbi:MAG: hypothetical protein NUV65_03450 [Candidatus Roizmanbacteria bacterium]|nr:hypothetical protein [Candidatus Roizmanbacteria bacterium]